MEKEQLRDALFDLHKELEATDSVGKVERALLGDLMEDIEHILAASNGSVPAQKEPQSLTQALGEAGSHFEQSHPTISAVISRTVEILSRMGI